MSKENLFSLVKRVISINLLTLFVVTIFGSGLVFANEPAENQKLEYTYLSPIKESKMPFSGMVVKWKQKMPEDSKVNLFIQFLTAEGWTEWVSLDEGFLVNNEDYLFQEEFVATNLATAYRYKVEMIKSNSDISPIVSNLEFTYIHANQVEKQQAKIYIPEVKIYSNIETAEVISTLTSKLKVISRGQWGADESLRYQGVNSPAGEELKMEEGAEKDINSRQNIKKIISKDDGGKEFAWPLEYPEKVSKIIVHHTATTKNLDDPAQAIRNIYYYHSITKGWGDIGYNYILDQKGNIYEGRFGGEGVVGGHAYKFNVGSIGIAVLGNYEGDSVPQSVIDSLAGLIKEKSVVHGIDPEGWSEFMGKMIPNIIGHKDVGATACPGKNLYSLLPAVRKMAKGDLVSSIIDKRRSVKGDYNYDLVSSLNFFQIDANTSGNLRVEIVNIGSQSWDPSTYLMISSNEAERYFNNIKSLKSSSAGKTVKTGESAVFNFNLSAKNQSGFLNLEIFPMINGTKKIEKYISLPSQVTSASLDYNLVGINYERQFVSKGQDVIATITLQNTGTVTWKKSGSNKIRIGTENPRDRVSRYAQPMGNRLGDMVQDEVVAGGIADFIVTLKAPAREGVYREYFTPVIEGVSWLENKGSYLEFVVAESIYKADYLGTSDMGSFRPGEKKKITMEFMNMGRREWFKTGSSSLELDISKSKDLFVNNVELLADIVKPGEVATISLELEAPSKVGLYRVLVTPKIGSNNLILRSIVLYIKVEGIEIPKSDWITSETKKDTYTNQDDLIRIGLSFNGNPVISGAGEFVLLENGREKAKYSANEKVEVTYSNGKFNVKNSKNTFVLTSPPVFKPLSSTILRIDNYENRPSWKQELNDNEYQGNLEVHFYENKLQVVNELNLEDYLKGLAEISATEHMEKIKAVIVLARSYAKFYMTKAEKFAGAPYHLSDDPERSQKYLGYGFTKRNITGAKAVEATKGIVVKYKGDLIKTPYFSTSDGRTRSAHEVWGWTDTPYLISVDDPGCKGNVLNGHGVGLSGCGSQYFANQGKTYVEIIKYYFKGVEVEKI